MSLAVLRSVMHAGLKVFDTMPLLKCFYHFNPKNATEHSMVNLSYSTQND